MSSAPNPMSAAIEAFKSGQDISQAVYGTPSEAPAQSLAETPEVEENLESEVSAPESEVEETPETESVPAAEDIEEIILSDKDGRKKLKVDWNNRDQLKKYIQMAAGARKWQSERDKLHKEVAELRSAHNPLKETWTALEGAFKEEGAPGVLRLLGVDYEGHIKEQLAKADLRRNASPEQIAQMDLQERLERAEREKERILNDVKAQSEKARMDREAAELKATEAALTPAFEKYRFAGKLGNEAAEHQLDEAIWSKAIGNLQALPDGELSPARIDKEFRTVAANFRKVMADNAKNGAKEIIEKKKVAAKEAATSAAIKGMNNAQVTSNLRDEIKGGNLKNAVMAILSGKKL